MKKIKGSENTLLTYGVLVPVGFLGAILCVLLVLVTYIINTFIFLFLLCCGLSSLVYGYLLRVAGQFNLRHKHF